MNENAPNPHAAHRLLCALVAGLASQSPRLQQQCAAALKCTGGLCLPFIYEAAANPDTKAAARARLLATAGQIGEQDPLGPQLEPLILSAFLAMICGQNARLRDLAMEPLRFLGGFATDLVIKQAYLERQNWNLCRQLLKVAEQLDHRPTSAGWLWLNKIVAQSPRRISQWLQRLLTLWAPENISKPQQTME